MNNERMNKLIDYHIFDRCITIEDSVSNRDLFGVHGSLFI